jgi:hypothetical protein
LLLVDAPFGADRPVQSGEFYREYSGIAALRLDFGAVRGYEMLSHVFASTCGLAPGRQKHDFWAGLQHAPAA